MAASATALVGGTLLDGRGGPPQPDVTVLVEGNHIAAVGPRSTTSIPAGARQLEASGCTILPGLIDLHQHVLDDWDKALFPQRGITSIRFAGGQQSAILGLRDR